MTEQPYTGQFRDQRMENAYYWAAQARGFMEEQVIGLTDEWFVEIQGGKVIIVMSDEFPDGGVDALETELHTHGFPTDWTRREFEDETRLFIIPTDKRLHSNLVDDWRDTV